MWRWLLALSLFASSGLPVLAEEKQTPISSSSVGPTSRAEAEIIWKEGKSAFEAGNFEMAAHHLQRLVDRYPGEKGYLEAHLLLGQSRIGLSEFQKAIAPLRYYVGATGKSTKGLNGRLQLGRAYLGAKKNNEALLTAIEAEKLTDKKILSEKKPEALLLKAQALIALGRDFRASEAVDAARKIADDPRTPVATRGDAARLDEVLKLRACARFPSKGPLAEDQMREQISARGDCLAEALLLFKKTLDLGHEASAQAASIDLSEALIDYLQKCATPVNPPGKRTKQQLERYRAELKSLLVDECKSKIRHVSLLMSGWEIPEGMRPHAAYVSKTLERLK